MHADDLPMSTAGAQWGSGEVIPDRVFVESRANLPSVNIRWCLFLIYYFSLCDAILKFLPVTVATVLRYAPEAILYILVLDLLRQRVRLFSFPLFFPLCACALSMMISGALNHSELLGVAGDFRTFFRFSAFAYIAWRTHVTPRRIEQFSDGFLRLTSIELIIGGLELIGGNPVKQFFSPAIGWGSSSGPIAGFVNTESGTWLSGTLSNYNNYGLFMALSCCIALTMYSWKHSRKYLWVASMSALAVVLSNSRHALLLLAVAIVILFVFHRRTLLRVARLPQLAGVAFCGCALIATVLTASPAIRERVASIVAPDVVQGDPNANIRLYMTLVLPPRFLRATPFFGQGPFAAADLIPAGTQDRSVGPPLKAAPDVPGFVTFYIADVVWVMILGLYGCCGLAAFAWVLFAIGAAANRLRKAPVSAAYTAIAQACLVAVVVFAMSGMFSLEIVSRDTVPVFWVLAGITLSASLDHSGRSTGVMSQPQSSQGAQ